MVATPRTTAAGLLLLAGLSIATKQLHDAVGLLPLPLFTLGVSMAVGALLVRSPRLRGWHPPMEIPLSVGMILLGVQFDARLVEAVGARDLARMLVHWAICAGLFVALARARLMPARTAGLVGSGFCGAGISAVIAAARGDSRVSPPETAGVVSLTLAAGAIGFAGAPVIGRTLGLDAPALAAWVGTFMPTTAEAVLIGSAHSPEAMQLIGAYRFAVNVLQWIPIVAYLALFGDRSDSPPAKLSARIFASTVRRVPAFVWGLSVFGAFGFFGAFPAHERQVVAALTNWAFLMALVGIGLVTRPGTLVHAGRRAAFLALAAFVAAAGALLALIQAGL